MVRIRYRATELSEGAVDVLAGDKFNVLDDNTVEIRILNDETNRYRVIGVVHPDRWESVVLLEEAEQA